MPNLEDCNLPDFSDDDYYMMYKDVKHHTYAIIISNTSPLMTPKFIRKSFVVRHFQGC